MTLTSCSRCDRTYQRGDAKVLLLSNRTLSANVRRAYEALEFVEDALPKHVGTRQMARDGGYEKARETFYNTRRYLLDAIRNEGGLLTEQEILACLDRLGLGEYDRNDISIYVERRAQMHVSRRRSRPVSSHRAHVLYGGLDQPYGSGHGHGCVLLRPDGVLRDYVFNRPPAYQAVST